MIIGHGIFPGVHHGGYTAAAVTYDGSSALLSAADILSDGKAFTLSAWLNPDAFQTSGSRLFANGSTGDNRYFDWYIDSSGR
jgi:hypothetical protein